MGRLQLQITLEAILGSKNVYYQPPENIKMTYPCIVYHWTGVWAERANNDIYKKRRKYTVTFITSNPDSDIPDKLLDLAYSNFDVSFRKDNLINTVFTIYN